jgi:hypothetical protein
MTKPRGILKESCAGLGTKRSRRYQGHVCAAGFARVSDVISHNELQAITDSFSRAAGLDVEAVNAWPSYIASSG